jgi:hypothetical protein
VEEELEWWLRVEIKKIDGVWRDDRLWFTYLCREVANSLRFVWLRGYHWRVNGLFNLFFWFLWFRFFWFCSEGWFWFSQIRHIGIIVVLC